MLFSLTTECDHPLTLTEFLDSPLQVTSGSYIFQPLHLLQVDFHKLLAIFVDFVLVVNLPLLFQLSIIRQSVLCATRPLIAHVHDEFPRFLPAVS